MEGERRAKKVVSRNRATVSCTECHRRRKKCSQGQPCRNCARRYPPVECIYNNPKRTSPQTESASLDHSVDPPPHDASSRPSSSSPPLDAASLLMNRPPPQSFTLVVDKHVALPRRDFHSVVSGALGSVQRDQDEEEYNFNSFPIATQQRPKIEKPFHSGLNSSGGENPMQAITEDQDQALMLRQSTQIILPQSVGCGTLDLLPKLCVDATTYNAELFYIYNQILLPRVWSIDGLDKCPQSFWDAWIPFTTFSPVILHANLLRASVWRESMRRASVLKIENHAPITKDAPQTLSMRLKAVNLLNARLRNGEVDDECITSVAFFFFNEWSFSDSYGLQGIEPHVRGLREMLRLRGGLHTLGASGNIAKLVMLCHYHLATVLEREAFIVPPELLQDGFVPSYMIKDFAFDSPLFLSSGSFADKVEDGALLPITARILDEMSYIISQIISYCYGQNPDFDWNSFLMLTITIRDQIDSLPVGTDNPRPTIDECIYQCVRITALVYCRAITHHLPFSLACRQEDFEQLFATMSRVSLSRWKHLSGVWSWILLAMNPRARNQQDGIQLRSLMKICAFAHAQREWQLLVNSMEAFMALQRWIRETGADPMPQVTSAVLIENITALLV